MELVLRLCILTLHVVLFCAMKKNSFFFPWGRGVGDFGVWCSLFAGSQLCLRFFCLGTSSVAKGHYMEAVFHIATT